MIYVLPTEEGKPPRAIMMLEFLTPMGKAIGEVGLTWIPDNNAWCYDTSGEQVSDELNEVITEHARNLGVPTFQ